MLICLLAEGINAERKTAMSFGQTIAEARKKAGLSQKDLASRIRKEDGTPISPQYLNDIERDRRNPPTGYLLKQFASELGLPLDYLQVVAGQLPEELRATSIHKPEEVKAAIKAYRTVLKKK